jgi:hypothetical protein
MSNSARRIVLFVAALLGLMAGAAGPANADIIFDDTATNGASDRSGSDDPVTFISNVAQNTVITNIGILDSLSAAGDIQFLVYDITSSSLVYLSGPEGFAGDASDTFTWKVSDSFSYTLLAGHQYYIGGVADVANLASYEYPHSDFTENGITSDSNNGNFAYDGTSEGPGSAGIPLQLNGPGSAVPEPSSIVAGGLGALMVVGCACRRRKTKLAA